VTSAAVAEAADIEAAAGGAAALRERINAVYVDELKGYSMREMAMEDPTSGNIYIYVYIYMYIYVYNACYVDELKGYSMREMAMEDPTSGDI